MIFFEDEYNKAKEHEEEHFLFLQEYFNDPTLKKTTKKRSIKSQISFKLLMGGTLRN